VDARDELETEVAMAASALLHEQVGEMVTVLTDTGVVSGVLSDYNVRPARLVDDVLHMEVDLRISPPREWVDITVIEP